MTAPLTFNAWLRYQLISRLLGGLPEATTFVEVGCGEGALATRLARCYEYVGYEPDSAAYATASARLEALRRGRVINCPLPSQPDAAYDVLGAFEVLEHIKNDGDALRTWLRWVKPGGAVIISVPGHPRRFGPADELAGHYRRYKRQDLESVFAGAGFEQITIMAYGFPLGYLLEWTRNRLASRKQKATIEERTASSGRWLQPPPGLAWGPQLVTAPFRWMQIPFVSSNLGTGYVAIARRPL